MFDRPLCLILAGHCPWPMASHLSVQPFPLAWFVYLMASEGSALSQGGRSIFLFMNCMNCINCMNYMN